jgi:hypothetical protein
MLVCCDATMTQQALEEEEEEEEEARRGEKTHLSSPSLIW